jgi:alkanesulfonate monooxygenase
MTVNLRFHWMLPKAGEVAMRTPQAAARYRIEAPNLSSPARMPDIEGWRRFAQHAEQAGIDSVLISFSRYEPDPFIVACALGRATEKLKFIAAFRTGLMLPTALVQQVNTLSGLIGGRISLNTVAGSSVSEQHGYGDFLEHDERYSRAGEFLTLCNALWHGSQAVDFNGEHYRVEGGFLHTPFLAPDRTSPELYVSGHSEAAQQLAATKATCWLRVIDTPQNLRPTVRRMREHGVEVCLRLCVICRPTRAEAIGVIDSLLEDEYIAATVPKVPIRDDSQMYRESAMASNEPGWISPSIWTGFTPYFGPVWTTLVGTPEELASSFLEYKRIGVSQFIISGWPEIDELNIIGREVLPLVRERERDQAPGGA